MIQSRVRRLTRIPEMIAFLLEVSDYEVSLFEHSKSKSTLQSSLVILREVQDVLSQVADWCEPAICAA